MAEWTCYACGLTGEFTVPDPKLDKMDLLVVCHLCKEEYLEEKARQKGLEPGTERVEAD